MLNISRFVQLISDRKFPLGDWVAISEEFHFNVTYANTTMPHYSKFTDEIRYPVWELRTVFDEDGFFECHQVRFRYVQTHELNYLRERPQYGEFRELSVEGYVQGNTIKLVQDGQVFDITRDDVLALYKLLNN